MVELKIVNRLLEARGARHRNAIRAVFTVGEASPIFLGGNLISAVALSCRRFGKSAHPTEFASILERHQKFGYKRIRLEGPQPRTQRHLGQKAVVPALVFTPETFGIDVYGAQSTSWRLSTRFCLHSPSGVAKTWT